MNVYCYSVGGSSAEGFNINIPLPSPNVGDSSFISIINTVVIPVANEFKPSIVLVSAGFDIMEGDFVGRMMVTEKGLYEMTRLLLKGIPSVEVEFFFVRLFVIIILYSRIGSCLFWKGGIR
jgi:acetoin utilization deacetylase AcuC-like enzyme